MTNEQSQKKSAHRVPPYRRPIVVAVFLILIIATAIITIFLLKNSGIANRDESQQEATESDEKHTGPSDKELNKVTQYEGEDPNELEDITGFIAYKGIDAGVLTINTTIDQYLSAEGTCELQMTNESGSKYTTSGKAIADVTSSICEPFNIPVEDLGVGHWSIEIDIKADDKKGTIKDSDGVDI